MVGEIITNTRNGDEVTLIYLYGEEGGSVLSTLTREEKLLVSSCCADCPLFTQCVFGETGSIVASVEAEMIQTEGACQGHITRYINVLYEGNTSQERDETEQFERGTRFAMNATYFLGIAGVVIGLAGREVLLKGYNDTNVAIVTGLLLTQFAIMMARSVTRVVVIDNLKERDTKLQILEMKKKIKMKINEYRETEDLLSIAQLLVFLNQFVILMQYLK